MIYGYARISAKVQLKGNSLEEQKRQLKAAGAEEVALAADIAALLEEKDPLAGNADDAALTTRLETLRFTIPKAKYEIKYLPADDTINWVSRDTTWLIANKAAMLEKWNALYAETR